MVFPTVYGLELECYHRAIFLGGGEHEGTAAHRSLAIHDAGDISIAERMGDISK
jgi:hypothetical protein